MKCRYCGKTDTIGTFCNEICRRKSEELEARIERDKYKFLFCLFASIIGPLFILFFDDINPLYSVALAFLLFGATLVVFPFATPETFEITSIRTAMMLVRSIGAILMLSGLVLALSLSSVI